MRKCCLIERIHAQIGCFSLGTVYIESRTALPTLSDHPHILDDLQPVFG